MQNKQLITGIMVIAVIGILTAGGVMYSSNQKKAAPVSPSQSVTETQSMPDAQNAAAGGTMPTTIGQEDSGMTNPEFMDGEYMAVGTYTSPGGQETVDVKLTLQNSIVTAVEVTPNATLPISAGFQRKFADGVAEVVVGKAITDIKLDAVSGSSLTPKGFADALEEIKIAAQG